MAPGEERTRPTLQAKDTLDATTQLTGILERNVVVALQQEGVVDTTGRKSRHVSKDGRNDAHGSSTSDSAVSDDDPIDDYDDLEVDPDTLIINSRKSLDVGLRPSNAAMTDATTAAVDREQTKDGKRGSIQIKLERTDRKGRYILTADDPAIKEILRKGLEREEEEKGGKKRIRFRDLVFTRQFTTFDRQNPASAESPFFGFFTLFWICMFLVFVQVALRNWRDYGSILGGNQVLKLMMSRDVVLLGVTDLIMCLATLEGYVFQKLIQHHWISWSRSGWIIQNIWQSAYLGAVIGFAYYREWPWTHTIFVVLHGLVFVMKQHSYAFYNGYLSGVHKRKQLLQDKLEELERLEPLHSPPTSPAIESKDFLSSGVDLAHMRSNMKRRTSMGPKTSTNLKDEKSDVATVASAIESGQKLTAEQMELMVSIIKNELQELEKELRGKADSDEDAYPHNLTLYNSVEWVCLPTLVYELAYPRQEKINWWYVLEKTTATFGVLCVMQVVSQGFIYPLVRKTVDMKEAGMTLEQRWQEFPFIVSDMLFPMLIEQLLTWYVIWECILNVLAELTCFADRGFYGDWWNSVTWDQYARDWNRPVHNFLLRHVYQSSISAFRLSRTSATFVTFLLSALVHELCMAVLFRKVRGYLFTMQLLQMPLVMVSKTKFLRDKVVLGNVIFWVGLFVGPALLTSLYLVV
ncbi:Putative membrane bound O-acyl transferase, MBOAT [Septoria linicola]|uniref:Membrane bound O-acyl transferase, MBOAT n=1 Tax=Septoria linicola TaxID=215465 RepID=A0A9Q9B2L6_9PEZI|nr:Putative membrane bound O-acyl transferase, MBOAT [Septoria linicola]